MAPTAAATKAAATAADTILDMCAEHYDKAAQEEAEAEAETMNGGRRGSRELSRSRGQPTDNDASREWCAEALVEVAWNDLATSAGEDRACALIVSIVNEERAAVR